MPCHTCRDTALAEKAAVAQELVSAHESISSLQRSLEAAERQISQLIAHKDQLEAEVGGQQQQLEELAAVQENLQAQVGCASGAVAELTGGVFLVYKVNQYQLAR